MKKSHILGIVIIAIAIGAILTTFADTSSYASFSEAKAAGSELHIVAKLVKDKEMIYDPVKDANYFSFYVKDNDSTECQVIFSGSKPQDFERSEQIVLTGKMQGEAFYASKILMKCPSKYNNTEVKSGAKPTAAR